MKKRLYGGTFMLAVAAILAASVLIVPEAYASVHDLVLTTSSLFGDPGTMVLAMSGVITTKKIRDLQASKTTTVQAMRAITDKAEAESRDLSAEEQLSFDTLKSKLASVNSGIEREQLLASEEAQLGAAQPAGTITVHENLADDPKRGFKTSTEFYQAVIKASGSRGDIDERLVIGAAAPTTYGSEGVGQDGGFAVPPDYATEIFTHSLQEDALLPLTDNTEIGGNSMVFPKDETTPWGTDGVRAYWQAEAAAATQTKPKLSTTTLRLQKLMALVPLTDELMADTNALGSYLPSKIGDSVRWKTNEAILFGLGNGTPQGAYQGNAAIIVAKDSGQATLTLTALNLANMIARLPAGSYGRAMWLINNDVLPALFTLTLGNYPIYLPGGGVQVGGIQNSPYGTLLGRPIQVSQHAKSFTNQGDVLLMDPKYYRTITKAGGLQTATSMHLYFDADATAFRTTFRVDGQPKIVNPINPANGSNKLSPFLQLAAR